MRPVAVGIIGCGAISNAYLTGAKNFPILNIVALADLDLERAKANAHEHNIPKACSVDELLADPAIELTLNLTVPKAHAAVAIQSLQAGKHTYCEKPLGINRHEAAEVLKIAHQKNLRGGCAPDTILGSAFQTARNALDAGVIGRPVAFTAFMLSPGHESWHPSPEFYYQPGGGPMFDMGPYYLTALLNLFGPVKRITGIANVAIPERTITSNPKSGQKITVETYDQVFGLMEFQSGVAGSLLTSFATKFKTYDDKSPITVYGTKGALKVADPNQFDGPVLIKTDTDEDWRELTPAVPPGYSRATGLADLAYAIRSGRNARCDLQQAFAVVDLMQGFTESSESGKFYEPAIAYDRPAAMVEGLPFGTLDP